MIYVHSWFRNLRFRFDLISLLRKHILKLPSRSPISKDKIMIFNCGKVWKEWNGWIKVVLGTRFLKFKAISTKFIFVLPGIWSSHFGSMESAGSFQNFCRIMFVLLLFVSLVWFCCWIYVIDIEQLSNNSWISVSTAIFNC